MAEHERLKNQHFHLACKTIILDREYSLAISTYKKNPSEETNVALLEAQSKWTSMVKQNSATWCEMCTLEYQLKTEFGVNL